MFGSIEIGLAVGAEDCTREPARLDRDFVDEIMQAGQETRDLMMVSTQCTSRMIIRSDNLFVNLLQDPQDMY